MISPKDQKIIQIDVTNACPHSCSHCTRFNGHHEKPFFMSFEQFKEAVDSLEGYKGMVGIMGGEPTLHPEFEKMCEYLKSKVKDVAPAGKRVLPIKDFTEYRNKNLGSISAKRGLWSSLGEGYYRHYETIQDTFNYQCINDHTHAGEHIALLLPRKELGIKAKEWKVYRENCWIQRLWSSSITPKGAFFCEVAAALDMLFNGEGGWKVEKGWWNRSPNDFGDQLAWCEYCSACLPSPRLKASEGTDIVSPKMYEKLKEIGSPKVKKGKVEIFDTATYNPADYKVIQTCEPYLPNEDNAVRVSPLNRTIKPRRVDAVIVCENYDDYLSLTLPHNIPEVDRLLVVTSQEDEKTQTLCDRLGVEYCVSKRIHEKGAVLAKGKAINDGLDYLGADKDWILIIDADIILPMGFRDKVKDMVLNPGCLYYTRRWGVQDGSQIKAFMSDLNSMDRQSLFKKWAYKEVAEEVRRKGNAIEAFPYGYFQLWNVRAKSLRGKDTLYWEGSNTAEWDDSNFGMTVYPKDKRVQLPFPMFDVVHLPHGMFRVNWCGRKSPRIDEIKQTSSVVPEKVEYVCMKKCFWNNRLWEVGETVVSSDGDISNYFRRKV